MSRRATWRPRLEALEPRLALSNFFVAPTGNDSNPGTDAAPWRTLQRAADAVRAGDTVTARAGTYAGFDLRTDGTAANRITFRADAGAVINQRNARTADGINLEDADFVTVEGFTIDNTAGSITRAGLRAVNAEFVTFRNNTADRCGTWGILTGFCDDLLIEGNVMSRSVAEHGIYVSNSGDRPTIRNNVSFGNRANGIHMNGDVSLGGDGIITGALVEGNVIYDNGVGGGSGINCDGVEGSRFANNLLYNNHASGISLYRIDGGAPSRNNVVVNNTIVMPSDGRWAVNIANASTGNTVLNNILLNSHSFRGSLTASADSLAGLVSDYNVVIDRFSADGGNTRLTLAQWRQATGQDAHSIISTAAALFVDPSAGNYRLKSGSPAIDAGTAAQAPAVDLDGKARPIGGGYDIGSYEFGTAAPPPAAVQVVDDGDAGYSTSGAWDRYVGVGHAGDFSYSPTGTGADVATWTFAVTPGQYRVSATWVARPNRAADAPYSVFDGATSLGTFRVDQRQEANDFTAGGSAWEDLGTVTVTGSSLAVRLSDAASGEYVIADGVRIERVSAPPPTPAVQVIDDGDAGFSTVGTWDSYAGTGNGGDFTYSLSGTGADVATWLFTVTPGQYRVSATWVARPNRATDAPYTILDGATALTTVRVNQRLDANDFTAGGTAWEDLATVTITGSTLVVKLSDGAGPDYVIADAIRIERIGP